MVDLVNPSTFVQALDRNDEIFLVSVTLASVSLTSSMLSTFSTMGLASFFGEVFALLAKKWNELAIIYHFVH